MSEYKVEYIATFTPCKKLGMDLIPNGEDKTMSIKGFTEAQIGMMVIREWGHLVGTIYVKKITTETILFIDVGTRKYPAIKDES